MARKEYTPFGTGEHITEKMKLNFLGNIFHGKFMYENKELICRINSKELLREYVKQVTENEMVNSYNKEQAQRLEFSKKALRELVDNGYFTMNGAECKPTDKFWNQDEYKNFYEPFKKFIK